MKNIIEIKQEVQLPGSDVILEVGDRIEVVENGLYEKKVDHKAGTVTMSKAEWAKVHKDYKNTKDMKMMVLSDKGKTTTYDVIIEAADTFKCPDCGSKVLKQTGYCVSCKKKVGGKKKEGAYDIAARDMPWPTLLSQLKVKMNVEDLLYRIVSDFMAGNPANNADQVMRIELEDLYNELV